LHIKTNVWTSQAYGCWLYLQLGSLALFFGSGMPAGLRIQWVPGRFWLPRIRWRQHDRKREYSR
jgi:hypothetical protein